jgi:hypothetical protein
MSSICIELKTECKFCGNPLPLDALVEHIQCSTCQKTMDFPYSIWRKTILDSAFSDTSDLKEGEGQPQTNMTGEYTFHLMYGRQKPRCPKCKTPLDETKYQDYANTGSAQCAKCNNKISVRALPENMQSIFENLKYIIGENSNMFSSGEAALQTPDAAKPILFTCPSCAGNLEIDGKERVVTCKYCQSEIYLPDELWLRMHPVKTVDRWYLVFDDTEMAKKASEKLPDWYYIPGFTIDKSGNCYAASSDDDTGFLVWSFSPDLKTRWVRKDLKFDEEKTGLALTNDGNLYLWDKNKHSLLKLSSNDGSTILKIEGQEATDDNPYPFNLKGCSTLVSDSDGTIMALINNTVARYSEKGERVQLWGGKTFGLFGSGLGDNVPESDPEWAKCVKEIGSHPKRIDSDLTKLNMGWDGYLYMIDSSSSDGVVARFDRDGNKLMSVYIPLQNKESFPWADSNGNIYIIGTKEDSNTNLIRISPDGKHIETLLTDLKEGGVLDEEDQVALAPDGTIYAYKYYNRLKVFSPDMKMKFRSEQSEKDDNETLKKMEKEKKDKAEFN